MKFTTLQSLAQGPVGLFTATYALMRQAKTQVIESLSEVGGQVTALFPAKQIYDILDTLKFLELI